MLSICCLSAATRTSKKSSRFELNKQKNLSRSSKGVEGSRASSKTRWLYSSQLSSRFRSCLDCSVGVSEATALPIPIPNPNLNLPHSIKIKITIKIKIRKGHSKTLRLEAPQLARRSDDRTH